MHAWRGHGYGPPSSLKFEELPDPEVADGQARIAIKAIGVNFPDVLFVAGQYQVKPTPPFVPGFEVAGVVVESKTPALPIGARVASTLDGSGGYATDALCWPFNTRVIPDEMSFEDAAAITITYQTAWFALHRRARLQPGEWVLVHAGAGGVGSATIQLAKAAGAKVIATAGGEAKVAVCKKLGADLAVDYTKDDFVAVVKGATQSRGADVIVDPVGGDVFDRSTKCVAWEGRIVVIGFTSGRIPELRANHVLLKNYAVMGLHWGMYNVADESLVKEAARAIDEMYVKGVFRPLVSERVPLRDAPSAMEKVASRGSTGKIVLIP